MTHLNTDLLQYHPWLMFIRSMRFWLTQWIYNNNNTTSTSCSVPRYQSVNQESVFPYRFQLHSWQVFQAMSLFHTQNRLRIAQRTRELKVSLYGQREQGLTPGPTLDLSAGGRCARTTQIRDHEPVTGGMWSWNAKIGNLAWGTSEAFCLR